MERGRQRIIQLYQLLRGRIRHGFYIGGYVNYPRPKNQLIDLGLPSGTKWAQFNLGSYSLEDQGLYFSWGNTDGHPSSEYEFTGAFDSESQTWSPNYGDTIGSGLETNIIPGSTNDAALVYEGNAYTIPTKQQFEELINNTTRSEVVINGKQCIRFDAQNGNYIIMPLTGYIEGSTIRQPSRVYLWSSTNWNRQDAESALITTTAASVLHNILKRNGMCIRPVSAPTE